MFKFIAVAVMIATPAAAQVEQQVAWVSRPAGPEVAAAYPGRALSRGVGGDVLLECVVAGDGDLSNCGVVRETPEGEGFGAAALRLAPSFRMRDPAAGKRVQVPVAFRVAEGEAQTGVPIYNNRFVND